jgi:hypothetical protein
MDNAVVAQPTLIWIKRGRGGQSRPRFHRNSRLAIAAAAVARRDGDRYTAAVQGFAISWRPAARPRAMARLIYINDLPRELKYKLSN